MMKSLSKKKTTGILLAFCLMASQTLVPAVSFGATPADVPVASGGAVSGAVLMDGSSSGVSSGFTDITDSDLAAAAECLRLLGVLDGFADGSFRPDGSLTRAQFCKMAVYAMNASNQTGLYQAVTVFPDVLSGHWAAPYVNLASKGQKIIYGYPDGRFYPENAVSCGQAVTILMRLLGYTDTDVGAVWPDGYLAAAASAGLTDGLSLTGSAAITRGQAAILFCNLLTCDNKEGASYASVISSPVSGDLILLSSAETAPDGTPGGLLMSDGSKYRTAMKKSTGQLNGRKGTLLLDKSGHVLTFVPTATGQWKTVTVALAKADSLEDTAGAKYTLNAETAAYSDGERTTYGDLFSWLTNGSVVTLYFGGGGDVEYVYLGGQTASSQDVVVVSANGSSAGFSQLAGGSSYEILKNGLAATAADLKKEDVAIFDGQANAIRVCDVKIGGYYENCWPNTQAPSKVTVMGYEFSVLPSAATTLSKYKIGSHVTLLLTADNEVAGAAASGSGNAEGVVKEMEGTEATVRLLCGVTVKGTVSGSQSTRNALQGQLVKVSSPKAGSLYLSKLSGGVSYEFDPVNRKVGSMELAGNALIFEQVGESAVQAVSLKSINRPAVPASSVKYVGTDWAGRVDLLLLNDATGNAYQYGRVVYEENVEKDGAGSVISRERKLMLEYGDGKALGPFPTSYGLKTGEFAGIALSGDGTKVAGIKALTKLSAVANAAWSDQTHVTVGGKAYIVSDDVVCYNATAKDWLTLSAAHAFSERSDLYVDGYNVVRAVVVSQ